MPLYTYEREDGTVFEIRHSIKEKLEECPETGQDVERVINPDKVMFKFKGAGFHTTDYDKQGRKDDDVIANKKDDSKDTYNYK